MKRALSLVLAAALVLGSVPAGFAATPTAGETLKGYGLVAGDTTGNLNEDKTITRGEMMVVLAKLLGKFEEAKAYSIPSTSKDVAGHWAANYIAYAEKEGWTAGKGNGMFDPQGTVTLQEVSVFMLKALGYTADWNTAVKAATDLGLLKEVVAKDATAKVLRADVFTSALNTINTPVKDTTVKLGVKLGVLKADPVAALALDTAKALSFKLVEVKLTADAKEVKAADFAVTDADGKAVEVKAATLINSKTVWLDTADQAAGKVYTVKVADKSVKFTGVTKDASLPEVKTTSKVLDNVSVQVDFSKEVDPRTALVAANYTIDNSLQVTKVAFAKDGDDKDITSSVVLTTSAQKEGTLYTLTVANKVTDLSGNVVKTADDANIVKFGGLKADTAGPKLTSAMGKNAVRVILTFKEDSGLDKATAENVANYVITNKTDAAKTITVTKAELQQDTNKIWNTVELTTSAQVLGNNYEIKVSNLADKFGNVISTTTDNKGTFAGQPADTTGPSVTANVLTNTSVKITFNEVVDKASAETVANYTINNDLTVVKAVLDSTKKVVTLTTASQKAYQSYTVTVANVTDEYGNKVGTSNKGYFAGMAIDETKPRVKTAVGSYSDSKYFVTVTFDKAVNDTAKVATNYFFGDAVGYGIEVTKDSDTTYKVRVNALEDLKNYTVKVTGVEDLSGNLINSDYNTANFVGRASADTAKPELVSVVALDKSTFKVTYSKAVAITGSTETPSAVAQVYGIAASDTDNNANNISNYIIVEKDAKTNKLTGSTAIAYVSKDQKEITFRMVTGFEFKSGIVYEVYANADDNYSTDFQFADGGITDKDGANALAKSKSYFTQLGANTSAVVEPELVYAYAINTSTVNLKFNTPVKYVGTADLDIRFTPASGQELTSDTAFTVNQSDDKTVLVVKVKPNSDKVLIPGTVYTVTVDRTTVKDVYKDKQVKSGSNTKDLTAPSSTNDKPSVASVATVDNSKLELTLTEALKSTTGFDASKFTIDGLTVTNVEYKDSKTRTALYVYFNNKDVTPGKVYTLTLAAEALTDMVGEKSAEKKVDFAARAKTVVDVEISDVVVLSANKVRVLFSTAFTDNHASGLTGADFSAVGLGNATLEAAYVDSKDVTVTTNAVAAGTYVDSVDLTFANYMVKGTDYKVAFVTTNLTEVSKSGAKLTTDNSLREKTFTSVYGISAGTPVKTTAGVAYATGDVTVTNATLAPTFTYAKVGAVDVLLTDLQTAGNDDIDKIVAKAKVATATNSLVDKGATTTVVTVAKTNAILVLFYDADLKVVAYSIQ